MSLLLGCIADDYTGATDLGAMISRVGLRVMLRFGVPAKPIDASGCDVVIVALKSRSIPVAEAVEQSLQTLAALREAGAERFFFKYCSTFDSTDEGNIGPVAEALADSLTTERVLFCPAFPENSRTVYGGYLFVHGKLLNESGMESHPLNPMTDAYLLRVLGRQCKSSVGLLPHAAVEAGIAETAAALDSLAAHGSRFVIADTLNAMHQQVIAESIQSDPLITGGSAIAQAISEVAVRNGRASILAADSFTAPCGASAVIAGSCSPATQRQVELMRHTSPACRVDPIELASGNQTVGQVIEWAAENMSAGPVLVYSTSDPTKVKSAHQQLGQEQACSLLEDSLAQIAVGLVAAGADKLIVAGGETSGAILRALNVDAVRIGPEIAPGVPWVETLGEPRLTLALKSGNFGSDDFFQHALEMLK